MNTDPQNVMNAHHNMKSPGKRNKKQKHHKKAACCSILSILSGTIGFVAWCKFFVMHAILQSSFPYHSYHSSIFDSMIQPTRSRGLRSTASEEQQPSPPTAVQMNPEAVGACLLIMDDNHWLIEWLAYHYYALPLTHLIVAVDPESRTSPEPILSRWKDKINIEVWNDDKINVPRTKMESARIVLRHRLRQTYFYQQCMKHHRRQGVSWVMLTDTDEFILPYDQELEPGIVRRALKQRQQEKQGEECINLPRYQFGVRDLKSPLEPLPGINISLTNVVTERFQYREQAPMQLDSNMTLSAGKNLVNVQLLRSFPVDPSISVHQVLPECPPSYDDQDDPVALVYHYSGSKEQFNFRRDPRGLKFRIKYEERQKFIKVHDPTISSWISKFADYMGKEEATHLLQDVGEPTKAGRYPFYMCGCPNTCDVDAMEKKSPKDDTVSCRIRVKYLVEKYKSSVEAACIKAVEETDSACGYECHPRFCTEPTGSFDSGKQTKLQSNIESVGRKKRSDQRKSAENSTFDYYLHGKIKYLSIPFDDEKTYKALFDEKSEIVPQDLETTWALSNELLHPTRNHDSVIVEQEGKQLLVNVLGRHNRHVEVIDLLTGKQWDHLTEGSDPEGFPLNDLNHICTVLVDSVKEEGKKELWMPCGFKGDKVNREESVQYARILDLETLKLRVGPKLPYSGGACVAQALEIIPNEPPMVCTFGGTVDRHDSGKFLPYSSCYDRVRGKWWFPFGKLPFGFDHGSTAFVPADACRPNDPSRVIILNFRTVSYGTQRSEMLAYDLPLQGWKVNDLEELSMEDPGSWYIYTNVSYTGPEDIANCPRDASGAIMANGGREILNFGGIFYDFPNGKFRSTRFSTIRSFDVCKKQWRVVGDLGAQIFALQTSASNNLQLSVTCGGEARHPSFKKTMNSPWCLVHRFGSGISVQNRHGTPATSDFADDFFPGSRHAIDLSLSR